MAGSQKTDLGPLPSVEVPEALTELVKVDAEGAVCQGQSTMATSEDGPRIIATKGCAKCGAEKELSAFSKDNYRFDGLDYWCKACKNESSVRWKKTNPEAHKNSDLKSRAKRNAKSRGRRAQDNPDGVRAFNLGKWRSENPTAAMLREALMALRRVERKYSRTVPELTGLWVQADAMRELLALATNTPKEQLDSGSRWRPRWKPDRSIAAAPPVVPPAENPSESC